MNSNKKYQHRVSPDMIYQEGQDITSGKFLLKLQKLNIIIGKYYLKLN